MTLPCQLILCPPPRTSRFRCPTCPNLIAYCPIFAKELMTMNDANRLMLKANLKQLRLPTMLAEWEKLAREAAARNQSYGAYLLQLTELEVASRSANAIAAPAFSPSRTSTPSTSPLRPTSPSRKS